MKPVSAQFLDVVRGSHRFVVRARVIDAFTTGTNPAGAGIPVFAGSVTLDATANVHATLDLTTDGTGWDPTPGAHMLQPYGNEVFVERGVDVGDMVEWVPLGYYRMQAVEQASPPHGPLRIAGSDRMAGLVEAKLIRPRQFKASESVSGVFATLVGEVYPGAVIEFDDATGNELLGRDQIADQDRYAFLRDLAASRGKVMRFDHRGVLVVTSPPDTSSPVWDVDAGEGGVLVEATRSIDRDGVFNMVVAEGEAPDGDNAPVRVTAYDANPESPTYFYGPYGQVPTFYTSSFITRTPQAVSASRAKLERSLGLPYYLDFSAVPNPALEPFDPVRVRYAETAGRETHVITTVSIPLTAAGAITATTRERSKVLISSEEVVVQ